MPSSLPGEVCREIAGAAPPAGVNDDVDAKVVAADAAFLAAAGIPFLAGPVGTLSLTEHDGTLSPTDPAGILFPVDLDEPVTVGVAGLADAGILFLAVPEGILFPPDPDGIPFPADLARPVTVGVAGLADAGILFPAVSGGGVMMPGR